MPQSGGLWLAAGWTGGNTILAVHSRTAKQTNPGGSPKNPSPNGWWIFCCRGFERSNATVRCEYDGGEKSETDFFTVYEPDLTEAEVREYLQFKQLGYIKTIKNCVVFFTVLTIVGMISMFLLMLNGF
jgi:hypothetical protein